MTSGWGDCAEVRRIEFPSPRQVGARLVTSLARQHRVGIEAPMAPHTAKLVTIRNFQDYMKRSRLLAKKFGRQVGVAAAISLAKQPNAVLKALMAPHIARSVTKKGSLNNTKRSDLLARKYVVIVAIARIWCTASAILVAVAGPAGPAAH